MLESSRQFILIDKKWTHGNLILLINEIKSKIGKKYAESITDFKIVEYKKMYGFTAEDKDKFAKLTFKNTEVMNRVKNLWYSYKENNERKMTKE